MCDNPKDPKHQKGAEVVSLIPEADVERIELPEYPEPAWLRRSPVDGVWIIRDPDNLAGAELRLTTDHLRDLANWVLSGGLDEEGE